MRTAWAGRARAGGREEYAALGGSDGGRAPPRGFKASDIAERSGISVLRIKDIGVRFISKQHFLPEKKGPFWILTNSDVTTICMINYCGFC